MTSSDPKTGEKRRESALAFSIMFFAVALLCAMLGWAEGVRHSTYYLHIPETGSWLVATAILAALGVLFFVWSRGARAVDSQR
jgi:putative Mn2+ efflux pump MntP